MSAKDNIYVLNYVVHREMQREGGEVWALFVDIKSAFDSVDRGVLWRALEERGVSEELLERLKEVHENTANRVRVGGKMGGGMFWTARGVRQGCPLSSKLCTLLVADLDKRMEKREKGGIEIGRRRLLH